MIELWSGGQNMCNPSKTNVFRVLVNFAGAGLGAGGASIAQAAAPAIGPTQVIVFGAPIPIWSAIFGLIGVLVARRVAPISAAEQRLGATGRAALTLLLVVGVLALIVAGEKRPIVALAWSLGLGWTGLAFVEAVAVAAIGTAKVIMNGFGEAAARAASAWAERRNTRDQ